MRSSLPLREVPTLGDALVRQPALAIESSFATAAGGGHGLPIDVIDGVTAGEWKQFQRVECDSDFRISGRFEKLSLKSLADSLLFGSAIHKSRDVGRPNGAANQLRAATARRSHSGTPAAQIVADLMRPACRRAA